MKLNKRLSSLLNKVNKPYHLVWDCCCDHGLLGFNILKLGKSKQVHFVDIVPSIIDSLSLNLKKYAQHLPQQAKWEAFCQDVADIDLALIDNVCGQQSQQLVIISGVGGELISDMLKQLMEKYSGQNIDFLLCPVNHSYKLRGTLKTLNFGLIEESLVTDNGRTYEMLMVNQTVETAVSVVGNKQWLISSDNYNYLTSLINHYQRITDASHVDRTIEQRALKDYQSLLKQVYNR